MQPLGDAERLHAGQLARAHAGDVAVGVARGARAREELVVLRERARHQADAAHQLAHEPDVQHVLKGAEVDALEDDVHGLVHARVERVERRDRAVAHGAAVGVAAHEPRELALQQAVVLAAHDGARLVLVRALLLHVLQRELRLVVAEPEQVLYGHVPVRRRARRRLEPRVVEDQDLAVAARVLPPRANARVRVRGQARHQARHHVLVGIAGRVVAGVLLLVLRVLHVSRAGKLARVALALAGRRHARLQRQAGRLVARVDVRLLKEAPPSGGARRRAVATADVAPPGDALRQQPRRRERRADVPVPRARLGELLVLDGRLVVPGGRRVPHARGRAAVVKVLGDIERRVGHDVDLDAHLGHARRAAVHAQPRVVDGRDLHERQLLVAVSGGAAALERALERLRRVRVDLAAARRQGQVEGGGLGHVVAVARVREVPAVLAAHLAVVACDQARDLRGPRARVEHGEHVDGLGHHLRGVATKGVVDHDAQRVLVALPLVVAGLRQLPVLGLRLRHPIRRVGRPWPRRVARRLLHGQEGQVERLGPADDGLVDGRLPLPIVQPHARRGARGRHPLRAVRVVVARDDQRCHQGEHLGRARGQVVDGLHGRPAVPRREGGWADRLRQRVRLLDVGQGVQPRVNDCVASRLRNWQRVRVGVATAPARE